MTWASDASAQLLKMKELIENEIYTTREHMFTLGGDTILWKSCMQTILTSLTLET